MKPLGSASGNIHFRSRTLPQNRYCLIGKISTSTRSQIYIQICKTLWRRGGGWSYYIHLPLKNLYLSEELVPIICKSLLGE